MGYICKLEFRDIRGIKIAFLNVNFDEELTYVVNSKDVERELGKFVFQEDTKTLLIQGNAGLSVSFIVSNYWFHIFDFVAVWESKRNVYRTIRNNKIMFLFNL